MALAGEELNGNIRATRNNYSNDKEDDVRIVVVTEAHNTCEKHDRRMVDEHKLPDTFHKTKEDERNVVHGMKKISYTGRVSK